MALIKIYGLPGDGNSGGGSGDGDDTVCNSASACPGIWVDPDDPDSIFIQGDELLATIQQGMGVPEHEAIVKVPRSLLPGLALEVL